MFFFKKHQKIANILPQWVFKLKLSMFLFCICSAIRYRLRTTRDSRFEWNFGWNILLY